MSACPLRQRHKLGGIVKNLLKKNQVIITALVIMVAVAGYLSFTKDGSGNLKNAGKVAQGTEVQDVSSDAVDNDLYLDVNDTMDGADQTLAESSLPPDTSTSPQASKSASKDEYADISAEDIGSDTTDVADAGSKTADASDETAGDAVLVSNTIDADFFSSAKVSREQTRAKNKETLMDIVNNSNVTESEKKDAINQVIAMTKMADKESAAEILLEAKGFDDVVVSIVDGKADVLINAENLTEQQMAQIEDIVKRKTGLDAKNIVITPVGVKEK